MEYLGPNEFVHLHTHTIFSQLDGVSAPSEYFKVCTERKWPALAITEHGVMSSIPDAYTAAKEYKIKYIAGVEYYYCDYDERRKELSTGIKVREWRKNNLIEYERYFKHRHITILAKNEIGYNNLLKINLDAYNRLYRKPRTCLEHLAKYKDGLIILSGCMNGPINFEIRMNQCRTEDGIIGAIGLARAFKEVFGDDFYIELQMPGVPEAPDRMSEVEIFKKSLMIAQKFGIKYVLTGDCHYIDKEDSVVQMAMAAIDQDTCMTDPELWYMKATEGYFKTRAELYETYITKGFSQYGGKEVFEQACDRTLEIADKCTSFKPDLSSKLPKVDNAEERLRELAEQGLKNRGLDKDEKKYLIDEKFITYREQMELELRRIIEKGYASYFLITLDLIKSSTSRGMPVGPGRGSCGGSLVCYLIGIHNLDPIAWRLSFNRMLSPSRGGKMLTVMME